jgi:Cytidylyltransferase family
MGDTKDFLARNSRLLWGLMLTVYAMSYAPALLLLNLRGYAFPNALLLLYLTVVVQISDVFQYVFGKLFGRTMLSPAVSPSKTVEGLVGGGLAAILIGAALRGVTPFSPLQSAVMSMIIVIGGFFGGFVLSAIQARSRRKGLGENDRGARRNPRSYGFGVFRGAALLPSDALLFRNIVDVESPPPGRVGFITRACEMTGSAFAIAQGGVEGGIWCASLSRRRRGPTRLSDHCTRSNSLFDMRDIIEYPCGELL